MKRTLALACSLACASLALATSASAQIAVLRIDREAEPVCRDVEGALQGIGVVADPGYLKEARAQDMDPASDAALELITPLLRLKLAVIPLYVEDRSIRVEYRDGVTGARLGAADIPRDAGGISPAGRAQLRKEVVGHLGAVLDGGAPASSQANDLELGLAAEAPDADGEGAQRSIRAELRAGVGLGTRDASWTLDGEEQSVELGAFPAFELGLVLAFRLGEGLSLVPRAEYQSSLAFQEVEESRTAAPSEKVGVRAHRFAGTLGLEIRLGGERSVAITPALGVGVRNLRPEVHHLSTPAYSLGGPLAQVAMVVPIGAAASIRVTPEAHYVLVGEGLRERSVDASGLSLGGELALRLELLAPLALELCYRQAHALLSSSEGDAGDIERFVTLSGVGKL